MMKQKAFQLACKLVRYGFTKNSPYGYFLQGIKFSDKFPAAATVHFPGASGALKCCGPMACKLNIYLFAPLIILVSGISVDSAPAMQAL